MFNKFDFLQMRNAIHKFQRIPQMHHSMSQLKTILSKWKLAICKWIDTFNALNGYNKWMREQSIINNQNLNGDWNDWFWHILSYIVFNSIERERERAQVNSQRVCGDVVGLFIFVLYSIIRMVFSPNLEINIIDLAALPWL